MFVHSVYFWLKPGLSQDDLKDFEAGLKTLTEVETVTHGFIGTPADTHRPVVDRTYSYGLTVVFADKAGQDIYQDIEAHKDFIRKNEDKWQKVQVYDFE